MVCPILISTSVTPGSYFFSAPAGPIVNNKADAAMVTIRVIQSVSPAVRQRIRSMVWSPFLPVWGMGSTCLGVRAVGNDSGYTRPREKRRGFGTRRSHVLRNRDEVTRHAVRLWERIRTCTRNAGLDESTLMRICKLIKLIVTQRRANAWRDVTAERMATWIQRENEGDRNG